MKLGDLGQDIVRAGDRVYIAVSGSQTVFVTDLRLKILHQINAENDGARLSPRAFAVADGVVYVTYYEGFVGYDDTPRRGIKGAVATGASPALFEEYFTKLLNNTKVKYKDQIVCINKDNYKEYSIRRTARGGIGNGNWTGFLFVSIRGGQQDIIETHHGEELLIFNPACEFATPNVCLDLD